MSLRDSGFDVLDRVIQRALKRPGVRAYPRADNYERLLRRVALRQPKATWLAALVSDPAGGVYERVAPFPALGLSWRDLALAQAMRPSGIFGSLTSLAR